MAVTLRDLVPSGPSIGLMADLKSSVATRFILAQGAYGFQIDRKKVVPSYLVWLSNYEPFREYMRRYAVGSTQIHIRTPVFQSLKIPLPPIAEQRRIAAILDKADGIRRDRKQAIQYTEELLRSAFLDMFGDPVTNPKGWPTESLEKVSEYIVDCPHSTPKWSDKGIVCLRTSNLTKGGWNWEDTRYITEKGYEERTSRSKVLSGDIILSREGTVGIAAIVPPQLRLCMGQRLVQVRPDRNLIHPSYLLRVLLLQLAPERLSQLMRGSTSKHLNVKDLRSMDVKVPPLNLQESFSEIAARIEEQEEKLINCEQETTTLFNSLLQRAFKGDL